MQSRGETTSHPMLAAHFSSDGPCSAAPLSPRISGGGHGFGGAGGMVGCGVMMMRSLVAALSWQI